MTKYKIYTVKKEYIGFVISIMVILILNMEFAYNPLEWMATANTPYLRFVLSGSTIGHYPLKILIWYLALYPLLVVGEPLMQEITLKTHYILIARVGKYQYIKSTITNATIRMCKIFAIGLAINFFVNFFIYHGNQLDEETLQYLSYASTDYVVFQYTYPYIMVFITTVIFFLVLAMTTVQSMLFILLFEDRKLAYALSFGLYYFFITSRFPITNILQPFDEYGFMRDFVPFVLFILVFGICISITMYLVKDKYAKIY